MDALVYRWRNTYSFITTRDSSTCTYISALHPQCITCKKKKRTRGDGPTTKKNTGGGRTYKIEYVQGATYKNIIHERGQYKRYNTCMEGAQKSIFLMHKVLYVSDFCYLSLPYSGLLTSRDFGYIFCGQIKSMNLTVRRLNINKRTMYLVYKDFILNY